MKTFDIVMSGCNRSFDVTMSDYTRNFDITTNPSTHEFNLTVYNFKNVVYLNGIPQILEIANNVDANAYLSFVADLSPTGDIGLEQDVGHALLSKSVHVGASDELLQLKTEPASLIFEEILTSNEDSILTIDMPAANLAFGHFTLISELDDITLVEIDQQKIEEVEYKIEE